MFIAGCMFIAGVQGHCTVAPAPSEPDNFKTTSCACVRTPSEELHPGSQLCISWANLNLRDLDMAVSMPPRMLARHLALTIPTDGAMQNARPTGHQPERPQVQNTVRHVYLEQIRVKNAWAACEAAAISRSTCPGRQSIAN